MFHVFVSTVKFIQIGPKGNIYLFILTSLGLE